MAQFKPTRPEKEVYSIRLENNLIRRVDMAATKIGISRNAFLNQCILFAMEHLEKGYLEEDEQG